MPKALMIPKDKVLGLFRSLEASLKFNRELDSGFKGKASEGSYGQGLVRGSIISLEMTITLAKSYLGVEYGNKSIEGKSESKGDPRD